MNISYKRISVHDGRQAKDLTFHSSEPWIVCRSESEFVQAVDNYYPLLLSSLPEGVHTSHIAAEWTDTALIDLDEDTPDDATLKGVRQIIHKAVGVYPIASMYTPSAFEIISKTGSPIKAAPRQRHLIAFSSPVNSLEEHKRRWNYVKDALELQGLKPDASTQKIGQICFPAKYSYFSGVRFEEHPIVDVRPENRLTLDDASLELEDQESLLEALQDGVQEYTSSYIFGDGTPPDKLAAHLVSHHFKRDNQGDLYRNITILTYYLTTLNRLLHASTTLEAYLEFYGGAEARDYYHMYSHREAVERNWRAVMHDRTYPYTVRNARTLEYVAKSLQLYTSSDRRVFTSGWDLARVLEQLELLELRGMTFAENTTYVADTGAGKTYGLMLKAVECLFTPALPPMCIAFPAHSNINDFRRKLSDVVYWVKSVYPEDVSEHTKRRQTDFGNPVKIHRVVLTTHAMLTLNDHGLVRPRAIPLLEFFRGRHLYIDEIERYRTAHTVHVPLCYMLTTHHDHPELYTGVSADGDISVEHTHYEPTATGAYAYVLAREWNIRKQSAIDTKLTLRVGRLNSILHSLMGSEVHHIESQLVPSASNVGYLESLWRVSSFHELKLPLKLSSDSYLNLNRVITEANQVDVTTKMLLDLPNAGEVRPINIHELNSDEDMIKRLKRSLFRSLYEIGLTIHTDMVKHLTFYGIRIIGFTATTTRHEGSTLPIDRLIDGMPRVTLTDSYSQVEVMHVQMRSGDLDSSDIAQLKSTALNILYVVPTKKGYEDKSRSLAVQGRANVMRLKGVGDSSEGQYAILHTNATSDDVLANTLHEHSAGMIVTYVNDTGLTGGDFRQRDVIIIDMTDFKPLSAKQYTLDGLEINTYLQMIGRLIRGKQNIKYVILLNINKAIKSPVEMYSSVPFTFHQLISETQGLITANANIYPLPRSNSISTEEIMRRFTEAIKVKFDKSVQVFKFHEQRSLITPFRDELSERLDQLAKTDSSLSLNAIYELFGLKAKKQVLTRLKSASAFKRYFDRYDFVYNPSTHLYKVVKL